MIQTSTQITPVLCFPKNEKEAPFYPRYTLKLGSDKLLIVTYLTDKSAREDGFKVEDIKFTLSGIMRYPIDSWEWEENKSCRATKITGITKLIIEG